MQTPSLNVQKNKINNTNTKNHTKQTFVNKQKKNKKQLCKHTNSIAHNQTTKHAKPKYPTSLIKQVFKSKNPNQPQNAISTTLEKTSHETTTAQAHHISDIQKQNVTMQIKTFCEVVG